MARKGGAPENLKPYKKGESGNLKGRPPKAPEIDEIISRVLQEKCTNKLTRAENIFRKMCIKAEGGDVRAAEMILDRAYGKVKQRTELTGNVAPLPITGIQIIIDNDSQDKVTTETD